MLSTVTAKQYWTKEKCWEVHFKVTLMREREKERDRESESGVVLLPNRLTEVTHLVKLQITISFSSSICECHISARRVYYIHSIYIYIYISVCIIYKLLQNNRKPGQIKLKFKRREKSNNPIEWEHIQRQAPRMCCTFGTIISIYGPVFLQFCCALSTSLLLASTHTHTHTYWILKLKPCRILAHDFWMSQQVKIKKIRNFFLLSDRSKWKIAHGIFRAHISGPLSISSDPILTYQVYLIEHHFGFSP